MMMMTKMRKKMMKMKKGNQKIGKLRRKILGT
jgi:hypothetical protein